MQRLKEEIKQLRPVLLGLVEAVVPPDEIVFSAIGEKTDDPYEKLMEWARKYNPLNKKSAGGEREVV